MGSRAEHAPGSSARSRGTRLAVWSARARSDLSAALLDVAVVTAGYLLVLVLRFDGAVPAVWWRRAESFAAVALLVTLCVNLALGLYGQIWRYASVLEARRVLLAGAVSLTLLEVLVLGTALQAPQSVVVLGGVLATGLQGAVRFRARLFALQRVARDGTGLRVLVLGAGTAGSALVRDMQRDPRMGLLPVGFLDDDEHKHGRSLHGVRVEGSLYDLARVAHETDAHQAVLAITDPEQELVQIVSDRAEAAGILLRVLPRTDEVGAARASVKDVRDLRIDDLLGREQVSTDLAAVRGLLRGRRVLVTGAGGSIGSEIARQVSSFGPAELFVLDNDETHLHDCSATLPGPAVPLLVDIRERDVLRRAFLRARPEVVFHAAAHKHVPLLENHPCEAVKTNVTGTSNVVAAAEGAGVDRLVFISTDKAVRPRSIMGASKAVAEQIVLTTGNGRRYSAVRFGNVLGSRGSVVPTFVQQIRSGGPVTITHPAMTRYFMSIPEAVQLVLQAGAMTRGGEVFMLEMGEPVRILDLAVKMIRLSGNRPGEDVEIRVTGTRPGEKIQEELHAPQEAVSATTHPSLLCLRPDPLPRVDLDRAVAALTVLAETGFDAAVRTGLFAMSRREPWRHDQPLVMVDRRQDRHRDAAWTIDLVREGAVWTPSTT